MNRFYKYITLTIILLLSLLSGLQTVLAQDINHSDTLIVNKHSPKKATLMSTFVPGLGQAYNKKYWKIPLIWGVFAGTIYGIHYNQKLYIEVKDIYRQYLDGDQSIIDSIGAGRSDYLKSVKNTYKRRRDLMFIFTLGIHVLNILDANVDAHFFTFDVGEDISFKAEPVLFNSFSFNKTSTLGIKLSLNF